MPVPEPALVPDYVPQRWIEDEEEELLLLDLFEPW
jgi:hypothetical protein